MKQMVINKSITPRDSRVLENYYREVSKYPVLTPEEEVRLARCIHAGSQEALDRLVECNLRFVISVAKQFQNQGVELADLISAGNIGLITAAKRFDETRGFKFCSYAVWWIRQSMMKALEQAGIVSLPANQLALLSKARKTVLTLQQDLERMPTEQEIMDAMELDAEHVRVNLAENGLHAVSIDVSVGDDDDTKMSDLMVDENAPRPDDGLMQESRVTVINAAMKHLPEVEREVVRMTFGLDTVRPLSLEEVSMRIGLCRERVRQIQQRALNSLKNGPCRQMLLEML